MRSDSARRAPFDRLRRLNWRKPLMANSVWCAVLCWTVMVMDGIDKVSAVVEGANRWVAFASPSIPPPPSVSVPVWSLASPIPFTTSEPDLSQTSMNVVTFASPVSVAPPKLWIVSLYTNTLTRDAFMKSKVAVLQLLTPPLKTVVPILGKRSGYEQGYSKKDECKAVGHAWVQSRGSSDEGFLVPEIEMELLPGCASYIRLKLLSTVAAGDHDVALCQVEGTGVWSNEHQTVLPVTGTPDPLDSLSVLYTGLLRDEGII